MPVKIVAMGVVTDPDSERIAPETVTLFEAELRHLRPMGHVLLPPGRCPFLGPGIFDFKGGQQLIDHRHALRPFARVFFQT